MARGDGRLEGLGRYCKRGGGIVKQFTIKYMAVGGPLVNIVLYG
jgi:hypothetical protein